MSYEFYISLHLIGAFLLLYVLGGMAILQTRQNSNMGWPSLKFLKAIHGISLLLIFVAGFGLLARTGVQWVWPLWVWGKLIGWLIFGMSPVLLKKKLDKPNKFFYFLVPILGLAIILLVELKPL